MDMVKFITSVCALLLLGVFLRSDACKCFFVDHPQWFCCNSNAAIKARFIKQTQGEPSCSSDKAESSYKIKTLEVLHGAPELKYVYCIVSGLPGSDCEYKLPADGIGKDYAIAGNFKNGKLAVTKCSCIMPWSKLTPSQVKGAEGVYRKGCSCNIITCDVADCKPEKNTCILANSTSVDFNNQRDNQACLPERSGCIWKNIP